jgi:hypothetical protein
VLNFDNGQNLHADKRVAALFPDFDDAVDLLRASEAVPDHVDRCFPCLLLGVFGIATDLTALIVQDCSILFAGSILGRLLACSLLRTSLVLAMKQHAVPPLNSRTWVMNGAVLMVLCTFGLVVSNLF